MTDYENYLQLGVLEKIEAIDDRVSVQAEEHPTGVYLVLRYSNQVSSIDLPALRELAREAGLVLLPAQRGGRRSRARAA